MRISCEHCDKSLPNDSAEAMICTYECTFCSSCVEDILKNVCPNCGGGFQSRPSRPSGQLAKRPMRQDKIYKPVDMNAYKTLQEKYINVPPRERE